MPWAIAARDVGVMVSCRPYNTTRKAHLFLDTCYLVNRGQDGPYDWEETLPVARLQSSWSGIQVDVYSNQEAYQVYSCGGMNGKTSLFTYSSVRFHGHRLTRLWQVHSPSRKPKAYSTTRLVPESLSSMAAL